MSLGDFMEGFLPAKESAERGWTHREKMNELQREREKRGALEQVGKDAQYETAIPTDQSRMLAEQTADLDLGELQQAEKEIQQNVMEKITRTDWDKYSRDLGKVMMEYGDVEGLSKATAVTNELRRNDTIQLVGAAQAALATGNAERAAELLRNADNYALSGFGNDIKAEGGQLLVGGEPVDMDTLQSVIGNIQDPSKWYQWQKEFRLREAEGERAEARLGLAERESERADVRLGWAEEDRPLEQAIKKLQLEGAKFDVATQGDKYNIWREGALADIENATAQALKRKAEASGTALSDSEIRQRSVAIAKHVSDQQERVQEAMKKVDLLGDKTDPKQIAAAMQEAGINPAASELYATGKGNDIMAAAIELSGSMGKGFNFPELTKRVENAMVQGYTQMATNDRGQRVLRNPETGEEVTLSR